MDKFGLPSNFGLYAEIAESISSLLDPTTVQFLSKYEKYIDYIHISDQYSGAKLQEYVFPLFFNIIFDFLEEKPILVYRKRHLR